MLTPKSSNESLQSTSSTFSFPDKLSSAVTGPMVWEGDELNSAKYVVELSNDEVRDVRAAVIKVKSEYSRAALLSTITDSCPSRRNSTIRDLPGDL